MCTCLFLGDSITDADHLFTPSNLGTGYVSLLAQQLPSWTLINKGQDGFTSEQVLRMLLRDGIQYSCDFISLLIGVNDIPVEVFTNRPRIPDEFAYYYEKILEFLTQTTNSQLILLEPFLFDSPAQYKGWHPYIEKESHIIQELAKKYHALFVPTNQSLRAAADTKGVDSITSDGIHLTHAGNQILAKLWLEALSCVL